MFPRISKIPGDVFPSKRESQGHIGDLGEMQRFQLEELLERQRRILANKKFISRLPDKGEKIISCHDKVLKELERRNQVEEAANLLSRLNIASEGKAAMSRLEWTGQYNENKDTTRIVELDSDDEEDPLKILAQPTGTGVHKKIVIHVAPEESLIKPEDIAEIETFKADPLNVEHVRYIVDKVEKAQETNKREPFKPYKTTKSNVHDPMKEKQRKLHKNWEVTAATPPLIVHGAAKVLSFNESLRLQKEQTERLQEIQMKHAVERLAAQVGLYGTSPMPRNIDHYRSHTNGSLSSSSSDDEEHEVHDEEDNDRGGTVMFTVDSIES
ncbi:PREDICTED: DNA-directed RNA polymerase II subunit GRINL1A [Vollenhovia emeryi]|uniref:DNA-directed RNA polymerase II subunit GRINL1A n=1 Tax=Vollenhovia emeryi TaxID=411798 RepID=UPI0005F4DA69|nr:PREDICTED: DNA-directed RNA polymerase II subunit GRINL1A [Vollenhovia emeryi]XP_011876766.1 PREDICTED: DNA-directed RNA polymerase II subunit GRINL1A [Vollenhovia emeryi]